MSNDLVVQYSDEQVQLIKNTVAVGATDNELALFINQCKRTGLDALTRQIYFIKSGGKVQIQTSVDGFRLIAERTGKYEGQTKTEWCGEDGVWVDVWIKKDLPSAARVGVYKTGFREALYAVALFEEYAQYSSGKLSFMWNKMPSLMIGKVAESLALRKAFPNDLSGLYSTDELPPPQPEEPKQAPLQIKPEIKKHLPLSKDGRVHVTDLVDATEKAKDEAQGKQIMKNVENMSDELKELAEWQFPIKGPSYGKPLGQISLDNLTKIYQFLCEKPNPTKIESVTQSQVALFLSMITGGDGDGEP